MDFGTTIYFLNERKPHPVDSLFIGLIGKIILYEQHTIDTLILYKKEKDETLGKLNEDYKAARLVAEKRYTEILGVNRGDQDAEAFASHDSGIDSLEYYYQCEDEDISMRFAQITDYFIKSSLAQGYALLESGLRRLCNLLQHSTGKRIGLDHLKQNDYLESIFAYLSLVIELDMDPLAGYNTKFKEPQTLRNKIMHNGGEFDKGTIPEPVTKIISANVDTLSFAEDQGVSVLKIKPEYLKTFYGEMKSFFSQLLWLTDAKLEHQILSGRLMYLFRFLATDLKLNGISINDKQGGKQLVCYLDSVKDGFALECKLTFKPSVASSVEVINQADDFPAIDRLKRYLEKDPSILLEKILGPFIAGSKATKATMMIYSAAIVAKYSES